MANGITIKVDTAAFSRAMKDYMNYSKRDFAEACNQHAYYIAKNATNTTAGADKGALQAKYEADSKDYPSVPLACIMVNRERGMKGKKGLYGEKMRTAAEKYIKRIQTHTGFLRSGWLPAIKELGLIVKGKRGKIALGTKRKGRIFGGSKAAVSSNWAPKAFIWNSIISAKGRNSVVGKVLENGIKIAMDQEIVSMYQYIQNKLNAAALRAGLKGP